MNKLLKLNMPSAQPAPNALRLLTTFSPVANEDAPIDNGVAQENPATAVPSPMCVHTSPEISDG